MITKRVWLGILMLLIITPKALTCFITEIVVNVTIVGRDKVTKEHREVTRDLPFLKNSPNVSSNDDVKTFYSLANLVVNFFPYEINGTKLRVFLDYSDPHCQDKKITCL